MKRKPVRFVPVFKKGKEHEGHVDGWVVHPDDRAVRELPLPEKKPTDEAPDAG